MKKLLILFLAAGILVACSTDKANKQNDLQSVPTKDESESDQDAVKTKETESEEVSEDNGVLTTVGQKIIDRKFGLTAELLAFKNINQTIDLSPVKLIIKDIKIIRMSDVTNQYLLDDIRQITDKTEIDYIQIRYEIENTEDTNIRLNLPIEAVMLNTGEQIDSISNDIANDPNFAKTLYGKVKNESMVSLVITNSDPKDIEEIKIVTGRIDDESLKTLVDEQTVIFKIK